ncbi:MAG: ABC transporter permease, partial [Treponema sp.]|nr:ABC transporter permease [Treponema sp.]
MMNKDTISENDNTQWTKVITAKKRLLDLRLKDVWDYRYLIKRFIKRDFVVQYKQTILGPLWYVIQPLLSSIMYIFVFGNLAGIGTDGVPSILFYFGGTMLWTFFTGTVLGSSNVFLTNKDVFGKVYFPRLTVPISISAGLVIKLLIQFALLVCIYIYLIIRGVRVFPTWWAFSIPLIIIWI